MATVIGTIVGMATVVATEFAFAARVAKSSGKSLLMVFAAQKLRMMYVVNEKSKTFHEPDCSGVEKMNPENRNYVVEDREDLLEDGYKACGICKP